jgi:arylformamidase
VLKALIVGSDMLLGVIILGVRGRIVDLSKELKPQEIIELDEVKDIPPSWEDRRLSLKVYRVRISGRLLRERMTDIDTMSHIGTHVETPSHYVPGLKDVTQLPVEVFVGEAVCGDMTYLPPNSPITPEDLEKLGVKEGDILLLHSKRRGDERPYISAKAAQWLKERRIKMLGIDDGIRLEESMDLMATHENLLKNDIPIIEGLTNLENICGRRFYLIALPLKIRGLESSPVRAIAILPE